MAMHTDPVCGMSVDSENAAAESSYQGSTYYFCSDSCRQRFEANPTSYSAGGREGGAERHEPAHTSRGGMTSPKFGAAGSGGAELDPIPEQHDNDKIHEA